MLVECSELAVDNARNETFEVCVCVCLDEGCMLVTTAANLDC